MKPLHGVPSGPGAPPIDVPIEELEGLLEQARPALSEEGYQKLRAAIRTLGYVTELLEKKETTLAALRELLCPASTEKTGKVLKQAGIDPGQKKPKGVVKGGRSMSGCAVPRQSLLAARSRRVGAHQGAGAAGRDRL